MIFFWILLGFLYFVINTIITITAVSDSEQKSNAVEIVLLMFFGLPLIIIGCTAGVIVMVVKAVKENR